MPGPQRFAVSSTVSSMRAAPASSPIGCARWCWRNEVDQSVSQRSAQSQSCEPPCVEEDVWIDVVTRLAGEALCPVRLGVAHGAPSAVRASGPAGRAAGGRGEGVDDGDTGGAAGLRPPAGQGASAALGAGAVAPRGCRRGAGGSGDEGAGGAARRERARGVLPPTAAPLRSIRARTCRYGGRPRSRARSRSALASDTLN